MTEKKILYLVHCIDTEGPLIETIDATFGRLNSVFGIKLKPTLHNLELIQNKDIDLAGKEEAVAKCFSPALLSYNSDWHMIDSMLDEMLSDTYRNQTLDDFDSGWVYSWHCLDHVGYTDNPRFKDIGFGKVFNFYKSKLRDLRCGQDEINWHFHPLSFTRSAIHGATSYLNNYDTLLQIVCRRIIDGNWFPVVNRPGFHSERPDSHAFMEQWIPFDYANQVCDEEEDQPDNFLGRFGDWSRAPKTWRGYHPSHDDYQVEGNCRRMIFRCLNVGTRIRSLTENHVREAFSDAQESGSAILSFANHDYRDMRPDVDKVRSMLNNVRAEFPDVFIKFAGAEEAAISLLGYEDKPLPKLSARLVKNVLVVEIVEGEIFGPQPFLAIKTKHGDYYHDNFDFANPGQKWSYVFDEHTLLLENIEIIGVGAAGRFGRSCVVTVKPLREI